MAVLKAFQRCFYHQCNSLLAPRTSNVVKNVRCYSVKEPTRFYKNVTITVAESIQGLPKVAEGGATMYNVNLDQRKLRTPLGSVLRLPGEALALTVQQEWAAQKDTVLRHSMHMTTLCNTAIDNPTNRNKATVVNAILEYLETDTICYWLDEPEDLAKLQTREWEPILTWMRKRYGVDIQATTGLGVPQISAESHHLLKQHLLSYSSWALVGYQQAVESMKSFILATALIDRFLYVEKAIALSRLEQEYQASKWGNVEEAHDIEKLALCARVSSAVLFTHLNSESTKTKLVSRKSLPFVS